MEDEPKVERVREVIAEAETLVSALDVTVGELVALLRRYAAKNEGATQ